MKKQLLLFTAIICMATSALAATHMVDVANYSFAPSSFTAHPGDTIIWMWVNGTHTTTSTTIPAGANSWNSNIDVSTTFYIYVPTVIGTYNYLCSIHASLGMVGSFTVVSSTGIAPVNTNPEFCVFPNPTPGPLQIKLDNPGLPVSITLADANRKVVINKEHCQSNDTNLDLQWMPNGTYYIRVIREDKVYREIVVVAH